MEQRVSYYIVIPAPIYDDETLKDSAKLLYGLISSLINEKGYCFASNEYLAKKRKTTPENISRLLKELEKKEYIIIIYLRDGAIVKNRKIYINPRLTEMLTAIDQNVKRTVNQNVKESNKAINCISNSKENIKRKKYFEDANLNDIFIEFLELRKKLKVVNSKRAIKSLMTKLSKYDDDTKKKMLEKSIISSWKDVYELKETKTPEWFDKEIKQENLTEQELKEMEVMMSGFQEK